MLEKIGVKSLDELINKTIPSKIRLKEPLPLAAPMTEREFAEHITELASQNKIYTSYIGMGWYDSITPTVIQRNVFENPAVFHERDDGPPAEGQGHLLVGAHGEPRHIGERRHALYEPRGARPVSYTHLDVNLAQHLGNSG